MAQRPMRVLLCLALAAGFQLATVGFAQAGGGWHRHGQHHRHHYGHRHHDHVGAGIALFFGGLVVGHLLTRPYHDGYYEPRRARATPQPAPVPSWLGNCRPTTGERIIGGRRALMSGTWCTDAHGRGYILDDSVRFEGYLD